MSHTAPNRWRLPMLNRDPEQEHRQASFLELFFDLCFVVAIAQAAAGLHHAIAADHLGEGLIGYGMIFFAIWWAWSNFTWFVSAYDNDDVPFRIASMVQIAGALTIAAGVKQGFETQSFDLIFIGYCILRVGLVYLWLRAARHNPDRRQTAMRYVAGLFALTVGWSAIFVEGSWPVWAFLFMASFELFVPYWAEKAGRTPWHPGHIAERYGLLIIIVLGESVLSTINAVGIALAGSEPTGEAMTRIIVGGLLLLFAMWWIYFSRDAGRFLQLNNVGFAWAYGHFFIFGLAAATGAGLAVAIEHVTTGTKATDLLVAASVTVPAALFLALVWLLHFRPHRPGASWAVLCLLGSAAMIAGTFTPWPILVCGAVATAVVVGIVALDHREAVGAAGA